MESQRGGTFQSLRDDRGVVVQAQFVEATIASKGRFEVRGGKLRISKGSGNKNELEIGPETLWPVIVARGP